MDFENKVFRELRPPGHPYQDWDGIVDDEGVRYQVTYTEFEGGAAAPETEVMFQSPNGADLSLVFYELWDSEGNVVGDTCFVAIFIDGERFGDELDTELIGDMRLRALVEQAYTAVRWKSYEFHDSREANVRKQVEADSEELRRRREDLLKRL